MATSRAGEAALPPDLNTKDPSVPASHFYSWLEKQPDNLQYGLADLLVRDLMASATQSRSVSGNSCARLCSFVRNCAMSESPQVARWANSDETCKRLFDFYIEWNERDPQRAMRLVLELVGQLICNDGSGPDRSVMRKAILDALVALIVKESTRPQAKSAIVSVDHLLNKDVFSMSEVGESYRHTRQLAPSTSDFELWKGLCFELFCWADLPHVCAVAGKLLVTILRRLAVQDCDAFGPQTWRVWLQEFVSLRPNLLEPTKNYILAPLSKADRAGFLELLRGLNRAVPLTEIQSGVIGTPAFFQLSVLEVGKKNGLVEDPVSDGDAHTEQDVVILNEQVLSNVLVHPSFNIRLLALSLLISSPSTTKPYSSNVLALLRKHLPLYHTDADAKFRFETFVREKAMLRRICGCLGAVHKKISDHHSRLRKQHTQQGGEANQTVGADDARAFGRLVYNRDLHLDFLVWYFDFLSYEMAPTASYQRHISALKLLNWLLKPEHLPTVVDPDRLTRLTSMRWVRSLLDLLLDPFDDVRGIAAQIVSVLPLSKDGTASRQLEEMDAEVLLPDLRKSYDRAQKMAVKTGRASHADGAARAAWLLFVHTRRMSDQVPLISALVGELERKLRHADDNLGLAAIESPVHGDFSSLCYIWETLGSGTYSLEELAVLESLQQRIYAACKHIWDLVKPILCNDSPEGHLPPEMNDIEGLDTKDLLSYSFQAIHQSSILMGLMTRGVRPENPPGSLLCSMTLFQSLGGLTFEQLSSLRHRGAFTTVSQTFTTCCQAAALLEKGIHERKDAESMVEVWYKGTLECIFSQESTTRRSAGIPALISGILASKSTKVPFDKVMADLAEIGRQPAKLTKTDGSSLPQVHALNCLRDVLRNSVFNRQAEVHISTCLQLAANSMKSEIWAIRNSGLLLLRAIMDSLLGTGESKDGIEKGWDGKTVRIPYIKYDALPAILVDLLRPRSDHGEGEKENMTAETVFPALDIVRRAGPPQKFRGELYEYTAFYLGSHLWRVRDIAARTLCSFLLSEERSNSLGTFLAERNASANRIHGTLILVAAMVGRIGHLEHSGVSGRLLEILEQTKSYVSNSPAFAACGEAQAAYLDVLNMASTVGMKLERQPTALDVVDLRQAVLSPDSALLRSSAAIQYATKALTFGDYTSLQDLLVTVARTDADALCRVLGVLSGLTSRLTPQAFVGLADTYLDLCAFAADSTVMAMVLDNLALVLEKGITIGNLDCLPPDSALHKLWACTQNSTMSPSVSHAVLRLSGALLAIRTVRSLSTKETTTPSLQSATRNWGNLLAANLTATTELDARFAATQALKTYFTAISMPANKISMLPDKLPALLALYDALNDDDDEVRDLASAAVAPLMGGGHLIVALEAGSRLVMWMAEHFGSHADFRLLVVERMIGHHVSEETPSWIPVGTQLRDAMQLVDALFVVEEQNLFVDPVREAKRWAAAFRECGFTAAENGADDGSSSSLQALTDWTSVGLRSLLRLLEDEEMGDDGPLGWASAKKTFALCTRVLVCARELVRIGRTEGIVDDLRRFCDLGESRRLHPQLLEIADLDRDG